MESMTDWAFSWPISADGSQSGSWICRENGGRGEGMGGIR